MQSQPLNRHKINIVTQDPTMLILLETAKRIAQTATTLVITGESGTGKELLARYVHQHSPRHDAPFFAVNCGAYHDDLLSSELFGHVKGAFTGANSAKQGLFQAANGGTLLLDEVGEMSEQMQIKLLRVLQEREIQPIGATSTIPIDVRIIAATHQNLQTQVQEKQFRQDLYYRLNVIKLNVPPLKERKGDTELLAYHFLQRHAHPQQHTIKFISNDALNAINHYHYPGNIRELSNIIEHGVALATSDTLHGSDLPDELHNRSQNTGNPSQLPTLAEREADYIQHVLAHCNQNKTQAAAILGIDRVSLWRKLKSKH